MKKRELLKLAQASRLPNGKLKLPGYKRSYDEKGALERIAKDYGAKNYKDFQNVQRLKKFKTYDKRAERGKIPKAKEFFKNFFDLRKAKFKGKVAKRVYSKVAVAIAMQEHQAYIPTGGSP